MITKRLMRLRKLRRINRFWAFFRLKIFHFSIDIKYDSEPFTPI